MQWGNWQTCGYRVGHPGCLGTRCPSPLPMLSPSSTSFPSSAARQFKRHKHINKKAWKSTATVNYFSLYFSISLSQNSFIQIIMKNPMHQITVFVAVTTPLALFTLACVQGKRWALKYFLLVDCQCRVCLSSFKQDNGLHLPFAETLKDGATFLERRVMTEKESSSWHNTTCSVVREVRIFLILKYLLSPNFQT